MRPLLATLAGLATSVALHRLLTTRCLAPSRFLRKHHPLCTVEVALGQQPVTQHHTHVCKYCDRLLIDETKPVSPEVQGILDKIMSPSPSIMGMGIDDQQSWMN